MYFANKHTTYIYLFLTTGGKDNFDVFQGFLLLSTLSTRGQQVHTKEPLEQFLPPVSSLSGEIRTPGRLFSAVSGPWRCLQGPGLREIKVSPESIFSIFILNVQSLLPEGHCMTDIEEARLEMPNWKPMVQVNTLALESNSFIHSLTHPFIHSTDRN